MDTEIMKGIEFASKKHQGMLRKGSQTPYIVHPLEVMNILLTENYPIEAMIAGLLHDTLEDTKTTPKEIEDLFGSDVLELVLYNTENKKDSWQDRKDHTVHQLETKWHPLASVVCFADKLSNLRSLFREMELQGNAIFSYMNATKDAIMQYYQNILIASWPIIGSLMYHEYQKTLYLVYEIAFDYPSEYDNQKLDIYKSEIISLLNKKPIEYNRLFPLLKYVSNRYYEHEAEMLTGLLYLEGNGIERDVKKAIHYFERALENGNMDAPLYLGNIYTSGVYVKQDWDKAFELYQLAKSRGCDLADMAIEHLKLSQRLGVKRYYVGSENNIKVMLKDAEKDEKN